MSFGPVGDHWLIWAGRVRAVEHCRDSAGGRLASAIGRTEPGTWFAAISGAIMGLSLAVGWGRGGLGPGAGLTGRYFTIMAPGLCCVYLVLVLYGARAWRNWAQVGLLGLVLLSIVHNAEVILNFSSLRRDVTQAFQEDIEAGHPPFVLAARYSSMPHTLYPDAEKLWNFLKMAQQANLSPVRSFGPIRPFDECH